MEDYEDLKKRIDHLQYDEIKPLKEEVNKMQITLSNNDLLTKQTMESNQKLSDAMTVFKDTMVEIAQEVKETNRISGQLADTVGKLNDKITSVEKSTKESIEAFGKKLDAVDNKSKFDIIEWLKDKWFEVVLLLGGLTYAINQWIK